MYRSIAFFYEKISDYLNEKKFTKQITTNDIKDLKLKQFDKQLAIELFNNAIKSNKVDKYGNFDIAEADIIQSEIINGFRW